MQLKEKCYSIYREDTFQAFIFLLFVLFVAVMLVSVVFRFFGHDEFEHIHSTWYVAGGYWPYVDFFQVHHPLLWFVLAPFITILGETMTTVFFIRFLMAFLTLGSVYLVFRLTRLVTGSREVSLVSAVFLISTVMFIEKGIQVRPDVPQVFFALLSAYFFLLYFKKKQVASLETENFASLHKNICLSALLAAVSFLFLQKSVFLILAYILVFLYKLFKKEISLKPIALFLVFFLLPQLILAAYLIISGSFSEYVLTNWLVPARLQAHFSPHYTLLGLGAENTLLWLLLIAGIGSALFRKSMKAGNLLRGNREMRLVIFTGLVLFVSACFMRLPFKQNFMLPMSLFCIPAACFFKVLCFKFRWNAKKKSRALAVIVLIPFIILTAMIFIPNHSQVEKIEYVLAHTKKTDLVYDGDIQFNLFRKDLYYFWYGLKKGKEFATYRKITGNSNRYAGYDIYRLIREKKPKFISDTRVKISRMGLDKLYKETRFKGLYTRID